LAISSFLGFLGSRSFPLHQGSGIAEFRAQHAKIADDDEIMIGMPENDPDRTCGNALAAICALVFINDVGPGSDAAYRPFRADLLAFPALRANEGPVLAGVREFRFDTESRFLGVDFAEMLDGANLETEAAARALVPVDFNPHDRLLSLPSGPGSRE
jgi:hypothetical protein